MKNAFNQYLRLLVPPVLSSLKNRLLSPPVCWHGDYPDWNRAMSESIGYDDAGILQKIASATAMVNSGVAAFERDGILFNEVRYSWPVLAGLLKAAADSHGNLRVLDFGGALGSSYNQNRKLLYGLDELKWCIVEQKGFAECGRQRFENENLKFFHDIDSAAAEYKFSAILLSSVLPYIEDPYKILSRIFELEADILIIDRTIVMSGAAPDRLTVQKTPPAIYASSYPAWIFNEGKLLNFIGKTYTLLEKFDTLGGGVILKRPHATAMTKGYIFQLNGRRINEYNKNHFCASGVK